jgi:(p)ppGpp synthase/HD superfamily hydrolase
MRDTSGSYAKHLSALRYWLLGRNYLTALKAFEYAQKFHTGIRKDGISKEFSHQIFIASYARTLCQCLFRPEGTLAAIFLHDICEDYPVSFDEIERLFGTDIRVPVELLTKKKDGARVPDTIYYERMAFDPVASLAKALDRAHNVFTMSEAGWTVDKQERYLSEVFTLLLPMIKQARRLFPEQEPAYENVKTLLLVQAKHIEANLRLTREASLEMQSSAQ